MHCITELPAWERLLKRIVWKQLGSIQNKDILDFGSGEGITANYFAQNNHVVAVEPSESMLRNRWSDHPYRQICADVNCLTEFSDNTFDVVICHNVLEYIDDKEKVVNELCRVLKPGGLLSVVKHNRAGRVMQMAVLLDDFVKANELLDGHDGMSVQYGAIQYYDAKLTQWAKELKCTNNYGIRTFWDLQQNQHSNKKQADRKTCLLSRI